VLLAAVGILCGCGQTLAAGGPPFPGGAPARRPATPTDPPSILRPICVHAQHLGGIPGGRERRPQWRREALKHDPKSGVLRQSLAGPAMKRGDFRGALAEAEEIHGAADPASVPATPAGCRAYQGLRNVRGAEKHYREVIRLEPTRPDAYLFLGNLYVETTQLPPRPLQTFEALVAVAPGSHLARYSLGRVCLEMKEPERARGHFEAPSSSCWLYPAWWASATYERSRAATRTPPRVYERALAQEPDDRNSWSDWPRCSCPRGPGRGPGRLRAHAKDDPGNLGLMIRNRPDLYREAGATTAPRPLPPVLQKEPTNGRGPVLAGSEPGGPEKTRGGAGSLGQIPSQDNRYADAVVQRGYLLVQLDRDSPGHRRLRGGGCGCARGRERPSPILPGGWLPTEKGLPEAVKAWSGRSLRTRARPSTSISWARGLERNRQLAAPRRPSAG